MKKCFENAMLWYIGKSSNQVDIMLDMLVGIVVGWRHMMVRSTNALDRYIGVKTKLQGLYT